MTDINFITTPFDWLSDLRPAFAAQEAWFAGTYQDVQLLHYPFLSDSPFAIACGAGLLADHVRRFRFSPEIIQQMGQVTDAQGRNLFQESFLNHLQRMHLRVQVNVAPEGTLLLPGEPLLIVRGSRDQILLLESAFQLLIWQSTYWATWAAMERWRQNLSAEEDTPTPPAYPFHPQGWKVRAAYIGGASTDAVMNYLGEKAPELPAGTGFIRLEQTPDAPLVQIRRLYQGSRPLGDVWLSPDQEEGASVSKTQAHYQDALTRQVQSVHMNRFQNLYQPVLAKGHPALVTPPVEYLRQRTLQQMQAFQQVDLEGYGRGWLVDL